MGEILEILNGKKRLVRSNDFSEAQIRMTTDANRLFVVAVSQIGKEDHEFRKIRIFVDSFIDFFPALKKDKNAFNRIDAATDSLLNAKVVLRSRTSDDFTKKNLVSSCTYISSQGRAYVEIEINNDLKPYMLGLSKNFNSPSLSSFRLLSKNTHFRLYDLFFRYVFKKTTGVIPITKIREILAVPDDQYKQVGHIRDRLLKPIIKAINRDTNINVSIDKKAAKEGRRIVGFTFSVAMKEGADQLQTVTHVDSEIIQGSLCDRYMAIGFSTDDYNELFIEKGELFLEHGLNYLTFQRSKTRIEDEKAYLYSVMKKAAHVNDMPINHQYSKQKIKERAVESEAKQRALDKVLETTQIQNDSILNDAKISVFTSLLTDKQKKELDAEAIKEGKLSGLIGPGAKKGLIERAHKVYYFSKIKGHTFTKAQTEEINELVNRELASIDSSPTETA